ncbi:unnamed protein product [Notodromas monacha]|uniref:Uncharacterized protein n=1 Tax=Notodromas monacha TaxID=399045 RepID=A0A7R9BR95_9CRUS|nr:unnamed protein product [Notodromas monacha]CAG0919894.1 unnamed protein product [Notodromas monacha]
MHHEQLVLVKAFGGKLFAFPWGEKVGKSFFQLSNDAEKESNRKPRGFATIPTIHFPGEIDP